MKHWESLDKQDKRDVAQLVFAQDRDGRLPPHIIFLRAQTLEQEGDDEIAAEQAAANTNAFRLALVDDLIASDENDVNERDRAVLRTGVEMTRTEFDLLLTLVRVSFHLRDMRAIGKALSKRPSHTSRGRWRADALGSLQKQPAGADAKLVNN